MEVGEPSSTFCPPDGLNKEWTCTTACISKLWKPPSRAKKASDYSEN